jgi:mannose-6-phosphate isomerase-like protein (cupin superfamily)/acyl carrier protein
VRISTYSVAALQGPPGVDASFVDLGPAGQLGVGASWARVAPGLRSVANQHDEIETWVIVAGEGQVFADGERRHVSADTVVQFEPFETHFVDNTGETDLVFASFYWRDGERAMQTAAGVEHRRFGERPVFVFSSGRTLAADVFVRYQRMTGADAWHIARGDGGADQAAGSDGRRAFGSRLAATAAVTPAESPGRLTLHLHELRADVQAQHRVGRVPASVKELADRVLREERLDVDQPSIDSAFDVLRGIEELGRRVGRDWRADVPRDDWKIVHFLGPDPSIAEPVLHPALYRLAHPGWTPDVDYHVCERSPLDDGADDVARLSLALGRPEEAVRELMDAWQRWLSDLGTRVDTRYGGVVRDAGIWTPEHTAFLARLDTRLSEMTGSLGPDGFSLERAAETLCGIVEDVTSFARLQAPLAEIEAWKDEARTAVALELAAARLLACCAAPLVPAFVGRLAAALGGDAPSVWPRRVGLVTPGTRIDLATRPLSGGRAEASPLLPWLSGLVRGVLRLSEDAPVHDRTLVALGMESLQAIALQYQILDQVGADISIEDLLGSRDVAELATYIASGLSPEVVAERAEAVPAR